MNISPFINSKSHKPTLYILIFITFIDFMGMGLVYPLFSTLFFNPAENFLAATTSQEMRAFWLGLLYALMPFMQFFSSPIWGAIADSRGRKKPLQLSLVITIFGHIVSVFGIVFSSLSLLLISRVILGISGGNISIVQASIADFSTDEEKAKNYGLYAMAIGAGFTFGPFIGGFLSIWGYTIPFLFASLITALNLFLALGYLKETHHILIKYKLKLTTGIKNLKKVFLYKNVSTIYITTFLCGFAWSYFIDFVPVYLIAKFQFTSGKIGLFYGSIGAFYAVSAGYFIRPFLKRYKPMTLFFSSTFLVALSIFSVPFYPSFIWLIPFVIIFSYFSAFIGPTTTTIISNSSSKKLQGEALGILGSVNTISYAFGALSAGTLIGLYPSLSMWIGGSFYLIASVILLAVYKKKLFQLP